MKHINRVDFQKNVVIIRYTDDQDPRWADERVLVVDWTKSLNAERLSHVAYHVFHLFIEHPDRVTVNDEVLQEWLGRLFDEHPAEEHETP